MSMLAIQCYFSLLYTCHYRIISLEFYTYNYCIVSSPLYITVQYLWGSTFSTSIIVVIFLWRSTLFIFSSVVYTIFYRIVSSAFYTVHYRITSSVFYAYFCCIFFGVPWILLILYLRVCKFSNVLWTDLTFYQGLANFHLYIGDACDAFKIVYSARTCWIHTEASIITLSNVSHRFVSQHQSNSFKS